MTNGDPRRKHPRVKAPREMHVAWKSAGHRSVSRAETIALGGLFLYTKTPPPCGSIIELVFDLAGREVRARATVRHATPSKGMGVQFTQMASDCRASLNQYLLKHPSHTSEESEAELPVPEASPETLEHREQAKFESDLTHLLTVAKTGTNYQLLSVSTCAPPSQIKQTFYALAQRFHPDRHMHLPHCAGMLKELMASLTQAYKTLSDETKRREYDAYLETSGAYDLNRRKTEAQLIIEESATRAKECVRAGNFVGSIAWLRKCVQLAPNDPSYHAMLGRSLGKVPQYQNEAIMHFQKAIALDPWKLEAYSQLAELYESMHLNSQAKIVYAKIQAINPVYKPPQSESAVKMV